MASAATSPDADRVVVVGPVIVDHYYLGSATRLDQTAAVPIVAVDPNKTFSGLGGAANAANNIAHMAMPVALVSVVGTDPDSVALLKMPPNEFTTLYVAKDANYQLPLKHRIYSGGKLVARYDMDVKPKANVEDKVVDMFLKCVDDVQPLAILISDYDKGICTERVIETILAYAREKKIKVIVDPVPDHMHLYLGVHIVAPNEQEALEATKKSNAAAAAVDICDELGADHCIVTCGAAGVVVAAPGKQRRAPAYPAISVDSCGAGDTVAAAMTYGVAVKMPFWTMVRFAQTAGAISVESGGAGPTSLHQIHRRISTTHGAGNKRINADHAVMLRMSANCDAATFGVANGIFDLLHPGHVSMLTQASKQCDFLLVLMNTDASAERIKRKPMQEERYRAAALASLSFVAAVVTFDTDTPEELIQRLQPDVLFKGPEYEEQNLHPDRLALIPGAAVVDARGGKIVVTAMEYPTSTTDVIAQMRKAEDERKEVDPKATDTVSASGAADTP